MSFSEKLEEYLSLLDVTARELAQASQLAPSTISRYLSGTRTPTTSGDAVARLAKGLAKLGEGRLDEATVASDLQRELSGGNVDGKLINQHLDALMQALSINGNRLARALGFDPSYISRIRSGQRRPASATAFAEQVARYVARDCTDEAQLVAIAQLLGVGMREVGDPEARELAICTYLGSDGESEEDRSLIEEPLTRFLMALDAFDLDRFLEEIHFADMRVPTLPFQLPTSKTYTGIEEMKQAELDFLRAAVTSRSTDDVIFYSDMPLGEMAQDKEFARKVMGGVAMLVRKGIGIRNIHDVHRPLEELFMGLEGWLPVYMAGAMESYYLPTPTNGSFLHFLRSAGSVAVSGEAVVGDQGSGRYVLVKSPVDVAYYRLRATQLLSRAKPLLRVFREGQEAELETALRKLHAAYGDGTVSVGAGEFSTLEIRALPGRYVLISKSRAPRIDFLVEHPALVRALEQFRPTLF